MTIFVLWITALSGPMDGMSFGIPYETMAACKEAVTIISDTLGYDHNLDCKETTL